MKLIFLHGLPGVGKLTVAGELATLTGFKLFHNHLTVDLVTSVFAFGSESFVELREKIWLEVFSEASETNLTGMIFTFAYDRTVRDSFVGKVQSIFESRGGAVLFVELTCSREELERRLTSPSRQEFGKLTSLALFRELSAAGAFDDPLIPSPRFTLDITTPLGEGGGDINREGTRVKDPKAVDSYENRRFSRMRMTALILFSFAVANQDS